MPRTTWHHALLSVPDSVAGAAALINAALQQALHQILPPQQALRECLARDYDALRPTQRIDGLEEVLSAGPVLLKDGLQLSAAPAQAAETSSSVLGIGTQGLWILKLLTMPHLHERGHQRCA